MFLAELNLEVRDAIASAVVLLLGLFSRWIAKKYELDRDEANARQSIAAGVAYVKQTHVDDIKKKSEDGTLTKEEASASRTKAIAAALLFASEGGQRVIRSWSEDQTRAQIEVAVAGSKGAP